MPAIRIPEGICRAELQMQKCCARLDGACWRNGEKVSTLGAERVRGEYRGGKTVIWGR